MCCVWLKFFRSAINILLINNFNLGTKPSELYKETLLTRSEAKSTNSPDVNLNARQLSPRSNPWMIATIITGIVFVAVLLLYFLTVYLLIRRKRKATSHDHSVFISAPRMSISSIKSTKGDQNYNTTAVETRCSPHSRTNEAVVSMCTNSEYNTPYMTEIYSEPKFLDSEYYSHCTVNPAYQVGSYQSETFDGDQLEVSPGVIPMQINPVFKVGYTP